MERLNVYCWLEIIKHLNIVDQIALWESCRFCRGLLQAEWQKKFKIIDCKFFESMEYLCDEQICIIIANIAETVEKVVLYYPTSRNTLLFSYHFPNAYDVNFRQYPFLNDEQILRTIKVFPNLRKFEGYCMPYVWKHLIKWKQLEDLSVKYGANIQLNDLLPILEELNLKRLNISSKMGNVQIRGYHNKPEALAKFCKLQSITLASQQLPLICEIGIQYFRELKQLTIVGTKDGNRLELFRQIAMHRSQDVEIVSLRDLQLLQPSVTYENLLKLELDNFPEAYDIHQYYVYLPKLKEIVMSSCLWTETGEILNLLYQSSQIEHIMIYRCECDFDKLILDIEEIAKRRAKNLTIEIGLNWYSDIDHVEVEVQGHSETVTVVHIADDLDLPFVGPPDTIFFR